MKIVVLHNEIKPFRVPLFKALAKEFNTSFYCLRSNKKTNHLIEGVTYGKYFRIPKMQDLEIPLDLFQYLSSLKPDIIISTDLGYGITYIGYLYAKLKKCKFVLWNEQWTDIAHPRRWITRPLEKNIVKNADFIFSFGYKHASYLINLGAQKERLCVVPNAVPAIDSELCDYYPLHLKDIKDERFFKIVCPGRLVKFKGHKTIIEAIKKVILTHPDVRVYFAGDGPERNVLQAMIDSKGLTKHIHILGTTYNEEQRNTFFKLADLIILASVISKKIRAVEAWGLVINEAAYFNNKIIVSDGTGVANELIKADLTGGVFKGGDSEDLSRLIISAIDDNVQWEKRVDSLLYDINTEYSMDVLINKFLFSLRELECHK